MNQHEKYMLRCLSLAEKGLGNVAPNPMVGAVLVSDGKIISEGYTSPYGGPHAEVNAISKVKDKAILQNCTLYVSLEPCAHYGKTPPCADLIVQSKIPKVVIGALDSFSLVDGKGIKHLRDNGIEVITDVLKEECREFNRRFYTFHEKKRPYIILKWAQTSDGFIDKLRNEDTLGINWITQPETKSLVHLWRSQEMAILVGRRTIENDNPKLDVRLVSGKNPIRIVLDPELRLDLKKWQHQQLSSTIIYNKKKTELVGSIKWVKLEEFKLKMILNDLYKRDIQSIIIEGGKATLDTFIQENLWDEARILIGDTEFSSGLKAPQLQKEPTSSSKIGRDSLKYYRNS